MKEFGEDGYLQVRDEVKALGSRFHEVSMQPAQRMCSVVLFYSCHLHAICIFITSPAIPCRVTTCIGCHLLSDVFPKSVHYYSSYFSAKV